MCSAGADGESGVADALQYVLRRCVRRVHATLRHPRAVELSDVVALEYEVVEDGKRFRSSGLTDVRKSEAD